jgi:DNA-binding transcriptional regulator LsrR (DeoR family)
MSLPSRAEKDPKALDRTFLGLANDAYQESRKNRVKYAQLARELGLTNQAIADAYGVTEAAVRQMLQRADK